MQVTRSDAKFSTQDAIKLKLNGESYAQIGAKFGASKQAVQKRISKLIQGMDGDTISQYDKNRDAILSHAQGLLMNHMVNPSTIEKASLNNAAYAWNTLSTHQRLLRGESTANHSIRGIVDHHQKTLEDLQGELAKLEDD